MMMVFSVPLSLYLPSTTLELRGPLHPLPSKTSEIQLPALSHVAPLSFSLSPPVLQGISNLLKYPLSQENYQRTTNLRSDIPNDFFTFAPVCPPLVCIVASIIVSCLLLNNERCRFPGDNICHKRRGNF
jgi:hypothetical protein